MDAIRNDLQATLEKAAKYICTQKCGLCPHIVEKYPCKTECSLDTLPWQCWLTYFNDHESASPRSPRSGKLSGY